RHDEAQADAAMVVHVASELFGAGVVHVDRGAEQWEDLDLHAEPAQLEHLVEDERLGDRGVPGYQVPDARRACFNRSHQALPSASASASASAAAAAANALAPWARRRMTDAYSARKPSAMESIA